MVKACKQQLTAYVWFPTNYIPHSGQVGTAVLACGYPLQMREEHCQTAGRWHRLLCMSHSLLGAQLDGGRARGA